MWGVREKNSPEESLPKTNLAVRGGIKGRKGGGYLGASGRGGGERGEGG